MSAVAVVRLRVIDGSTIELRDGVPKTRGDCPTARPCPHIRCKYHLWLDTFDPHWNSPAGKPQRPSTLRPAWLEDPMPETCALDIAERTRREDRVMEYSEIGAVMGKHPNFIESLVARIRGRKPRKTTG